RSRAPGWSALWASRRTDAHFVTTYHGAYKEDWPLKRRYNAVMASGERVIAISHFIAGLIAERHPVDPARIRIIPRGVDETAFTPALVSRDRTEQLASRWRLPTGVPIVMLPGRIAGWKGQHVLISALPRIRPPALVVLVGHDPKGEVPRLLALARKLGVADRLRWIGECHDMPAALLVADLVVSASTEPEAFGRVVIEAQAMERMVIATDHGGSAETVKQDETGWLIAPANPEALANAINDALSLSRGQRRRIGTQAREQVLRRYTTKAMQESTLALYRELV
ncbi:MAG: glycosyltransferase family 4 protein, partial [Acetobacteraceae bacterium]|nr:glycosyltransferase family 4 protein [Acetobacteraceae bacterium]